MEPASMLKPGFIDLSHHNTIPESLEPAYQAGILGCIHKCTEGTSYVDSKVDSRGYLATKAGMMWGLYHFVRPGSMVEQVDFFLSTAEEVSDIEETLFALDWEDTAVSLESAVAFMTRLEGISGRSPVLYSGHVLKEALNGKPDPRLSRYRLWLAQYGSSPTLPPGWDRYWGWQYTDQGSVPGITPPTDLNAFDGTAEELLAGWSGREAVPVPPPSPQPLTVTILVPPGVQVNVITQRS
jgi:lysozyme